MADPGPSDKGGGGHPDPEIRSGDGLQKKIFSALRASVWSKNKGVVPPVPPLDPPLLLDVMITTEH